MRRRGAEFAGWMLALVVASPVAAQRIDCTEAAYERAIADANAAGGNTTITFNCAPGTIIPITPGRYGYRVITASNVVIDGENKVSLDMTPPWWDAITNLCGGANCDPDGDNLPNACPDTNDGTTSMWVLQIRGSGSKLKNITYRYFMEGVRMEASGAELDGVTGVMPGDEVLSNPGGSNVVIRNSTFLNACDKNIQAYGNEPLGGTNWDMQIYDTTISNSSSHIRMSGSSARGRFLLERVTFNAADPPSSLFTARGPYIGDEGGTEPIALYMKDSTVTGTTRGLRITGAAHYISLGGNTFSGNSLRGLQCSGSSRCLVQNDTFTGNGGGSTGGDPIPGYGGIAVGQSAVVDAGGGSQTLDGAIRSSSGNNTLTGNRSSSDTTLDFHNLTTVAMQAQNNWWGDVDPSNQVTGPVTYSPFLSSPPGSGGGTAPTDVENVRRTDRR
ncbi:MAG TPA: hypothetical protein VF139_07540 [Candidatus Polarisedimenticolaceae bacterium]